MKVTIPHEHVQELRFALAEQVERDEDLIRQTEDEMPSADTSNVVRRLRFYRDPASRLSEQLSLSAGCADEARLERRINQRWSAPRRARQRSSAQTACRHRGGCASRGRQQSLRLVAVSLTSPDRDRPPRASE